MHHLGITGYGGKTSSGPKTIPFQQEAVQGGISVIRVIFTGREFRKDFGFRRF
tara:strand:+ start:984 stop:1142 length:159 start_codon:yes stop_codon:yes gene_type:complete